MTASLIPAERIAELLDRCDKEDRYNAPDRRFLYTSEIRMLLGVGPAPSYDALAQAIQEDQDKEQPAHSGAELDVVDGTVIDGRQALIDSGDLPGPDGAFMTKDGREALAQFRAKWRAQNEESS